MGLYRDILLPPLVHLACSTPLVAEQRRLVVPFARGRVLEVGMGSALNLPHYDANRVERVYGLEPSAAMRKRAHPRIEAAPFDVTWLDAPPDGFRIPLPDRSVDTVLLTFTLCTLPDWTRSLAEMRRVLAPGGRLLFLEHGAARDRGVRDWQDRIDPVWTRLAGGCHLNREIPDLIRQAGFEIGAVDAGYLAGAPRIVGYTYKGWAKRVDA